jgi:hypothetical protein
MVWWIWASALLAWVVLACGAALGLGASAKVVQARERERAARPWDDEDVEWGSEIPAPPAAPDRRQSSL